jgi:hypothetical protein
MLAKKCILKYLKSKPKKCNYVNFSSIFVLKKIVTSVQRCKVDDSALIGVVVGRNFAELNVSQVEDGGQNTVDGVHLVLFEAEQFESLLELLEAAHVDLLGGLVSAVAGQIAVPAAQRAVQVEPLHAAVPLQAVVHVVEHVEVPFTTGKRDII